MKEDQVINGYRILQDFTSAGGGLSKWTFAEKNRKVFFIKEFLHPTYPLPDSPGSEKVKSRKLKQCVAFESHHKGLMDAIASSSTPGGNLISTIDFFRFGAKYYKVTEKVDVSSIKPAQIATLPLHQRILILITIAHSLRILHKLNIVHGDLKLDNILIKKTRLGSYTSKLIDFDNSYFSENPPEMAADVVGDMVFYSPELGRYIRQDPNIKGSDLTVKSDIFALGLLSSLYLTGKLPVFDRSKFPYAWVAVNSGTLLAFEDADLSTEINGMVNSMLNPVYESRPAIDSIFDQLREIIKNGPKPQITAPPIENAIPSGTSSPKPETTNLKGNMFGPPPPKVPPKKIPPPPPSKDKIDPNTGLKGTLINKKDL